MTRDGKARRICRGYGRSALYRWVWVVALLTSLALVSAGLAASPNAEHAYRLAPGDRITVTVFGQAELSGDIVVDDAGRISLPLIDAIDVTGLTVLECQKRIVDRLVNGILNQPAVSVRISEFRPIYVLGDVRVPGSYAFRYGATAKTAVALAGGYGLPEPIQNAAVSEFLLADERLRDLQFQKQALLVRQARLEAQRDARGSFSPPTLPDVAEGVETTDLAAAEKETFDSQAAMLRTQLELLQSQKPRLQEEIKAINAQMVAERRSLELVKQESDEYGRLVQQGLGRRNAEMELKVDEARHESDVWRLVAELSRLQVSIGDLDLKILDIQASFKRQVINDLQDVRQRIKQLDVTLPTVREVREVKLQQAGSIAGLETPHSISVTRIQNGVATAFQISDTTLLEPGDVVEVKKLLPRDLGRPGVRMGAAEIRNELGSAFR
jgi:polysaccharide export outer membrane protein